MSVMEEMVWFRLRLMALDDVCEGDEGKLDCPLTGGGSSRWGSLFD